MANCASCVVFIDFVASQFTENKTGLAQDETDRKKVQNYNA